MKLLKSRKGFTLIELLVVIGILAVLAAIAIPSVAGLIDRANVSADKTNSNEMTNAIERFTSEYELYCQDIASGELDPENMDAAQGRVFNVTGVTDRAGIEALEKGADADTNADGKAIYRDTKYPVNAETLQAIVENYTKTSSATFEPKQSDMAYWYSPACGVVVVAEPDSTVGEKNAMILSKKDAKGNALVDEGADATVWINLTDEAALSAGLEGGNNENNGNENVGENPVNPNPVNTVVFNQPYVSVNDDSLYVIFFEDGSCDLCGELAPANTFSYEGASIYTEGVEIGTVCDYGQKLILDGEELVLGERKTIDVEYGYMYRGFDGIDYSGIVLYENKDCIYMQYGSYYYFPQSVTYSGDKAYLKIGNIDGEAIMENGNLYINGDLFEKTTTSDFKIVGNSILSKDGKTFKGYAMDATTVIIPDGVTNIITRVLRFTSAETVHIPASVTNIETQAFEFCDNLTDIYFEGTQAQWDAATASMTSGLPTGVNLHILG